MIIGGGYYLCLPVCSSPPPKNPPRIPPAPSCAAEAPPQNKKEPRQSKSFSSRKNSFALPRPNCIPHSTCPNTWRAEPRKKNTLSFFKRNFTPAKSEMQGVFFFRGCRRVREAEWSAYHCTFPLSRLARARAYSRVRALPCGMFRLFILEIGSNLVQ